MNLSQLVEDTNGQSEVILKRLRSYAEIETPTGNQQALNSLGEVIRADFEDLGASSQTQSHPTGDHLIIDIPGTGSSAGNLPILVLAHHDTVWPLGTLKQMPLTHRGDTLWGPGTYDMKSGLAILHEALSQLHGKNLDRSAVRLIVVADEEIGSPTARALIESQVGQVSCALGLEPPHLDGGLKTSRWGSTRIRLSVTGRSAHAALEPEKGVSAIEELVGQITNLRGLMTSYPSVLCNFGTIGGGGRTNVVAAQAFVDVGLRFKDALTETEVLSKLAELKPIHPEAQVEVTVLSNRPAWNESEAGAMLLKMVQTAAASIGQEITGRPAAGAADTNVTGWSGIPSLDGFGAWGKGAHASDEQVHVPSLAPRAQLLAAVIHQVALSPIPTQ